MKKKLSKLDIKIFRLKDLCCREHEILGEQCERSYQGFRPRGKYKDLSLIEIYSICDVFDEIQKLSHNDIHKSIDIIWDKLDTHVREYIPDRIFILAASLYEINLKKIKNNENKTA